MSHSLYDSLINVLDVFIEEFGGAIRLRGIQASLLIQQATLEGRGISISEVRKVTGAPLENIRRHFTRQVEQGNLIAIPDPEDDRVVRYQVTRQENHQRVAHRLAVRLATSGPPAGILHTESRSFDAGTYQALIAVLQAFANSMDGGLRIRGIKMAIVIQQATLAGTGMTASQIARQSGAALETVRRYIQNYVDLDNLKMIEDPDDSRASRVLYTDAVQVDQMLRTIAADLDTLDWQALNVA